MQKVLILGGSGFIGKSLINEMNKDEQFDCYGTYFQNSISLSEDRSFKLNIDDEDRITNILDMVKPEIIVSCLRGDFNKQLILHRKAAQYLKKNGGRLYFFSTTNVFDNDLSRPHYEDDLPDSCTDYGQYKTACEKQIRGILADDACILRIPQMWGKDSPRMKALLKTLHNNEHITVYPNLFYNTNTDVMAARQLSYIINNNLRGIFHLASENIINYEEFYKHLISGLGFKETVIEEDPAEKGQFALLSKRKDEFPEDLRITNQEVIDYLLS